MPPTDCRMLARFSESWQASSRQQHSLPSGVLSRHHLPRRKLLLRPPPQQARLLLTTNTLPRGLQFSGLYLLSFTILIGLVLYSSNSTYIALDPPRVQAVPQPCGACCGLACLGPGGALGHLHQPGPGDGRGALRARGLDVACACLPSTLYIEKGIY